MRHNSMLNPATAKKKAGEKAERQHVFSELLKGDTRLRVPARAIETVHTLKREDGPELVFLVKIYGALETPGSELMTISCVNAESGLETELRCDEKFPVSIRFREQTDPERVAYVKEQVERAGGFKTLLSAFRTKFPRQQI
jgi:hypothetical protein